MREGWSDDGTCRFQIPALLKDRRFSGGGFRRLRGHFRCTSIALQCLLLLALRLKQRTEIHVRIHALRHEVQGEAEERFRFGTFAAFAEAYAEIVRRLRMVAIECQGKPPWLEFLELSELVLSGDEVVEVAPTITENI